MQILHPFSGSVTQHAEEISDPDQHRPGHCPQCEAKHSLTAHGFYCRTLVDLAFDGVIRVRRYLCRILGDPTLQVSTKGCREIATSACSREGSKIFFCFPNSLIGV